jgi:hypothetical protein
MRSVLGYSVFVIGLVFLVQAFFPGSLSPNFSVSAPFASVSLPQADPARTTTIAKNVHASRVASFSPGQQLGDGPASSLDFVAFFSSQFAALKPTPAIARPAAGDVAARDVALGPWRSAVVTVAADTSPVAPKTAAPLDGRSRAALAREIQTELKRVGCYGGAIDGSWGTASKRAMVAFIERVNASLPLNEPDDILLLLVKSHTPGTCGISCPVGQSLAQNNRCVPDAILAHAGKQIRPAPEPPKTTLVASAVSRTTDAASLLPASPVQPARDGWPLPGRMSIGGPDLGRTAEAPGAAPLPADASKLAYTVAGDSAPGSVGEAQVSVEGGAAITEVPNPDLAAKRKTVSRSKASNGSNRKNRYAGEDRYRSVKHLFEHPLGRL